MKKIILSFLCVFALSFTYGQGTSSSSNLGFNQVLNLSFSASYMASNSQKFTNLGTFTVPNNKVYKLTSGSSYYLNNDGKSYLSTSMKVEEHVLHETSTSASTAVYGPVWLSAGTYNVFVRYNSNSTGTLKAALSVVEFNIE